MRIPPEVMALIIIGFATGVAGFVSNVFINAYQDSTLITQQVEITHLQHQITVLMRK